MSNVKCQISNNDHQFQSEIVNSLRGFTLIELLVTIAVIGILSSIMLVNLQGFRERTRDTGRKRDLRTLQTALELYRADTSSYPASLPPCGASLEAGNVMYLRQIPCDPLTRESYNYITSGAVYTLFACLENVNDQERDTTPQSGCSTASLTVLSP